MSDIRNMDALIAEEIYGIEVFYDNDNLLDEDGNTIPFWSTNILCSWDLIKKFQAHNHIDLSWDPCTKDWSCRIVCKNFPIIDIKSTERTAPLAICRAILAYSVSH